MNILKEGELEMKGDMPKEVHHIRKGWRQPKWGFAVAVSLCGVDVYDKYRFDEPRLPGQVMCKKCLKMSEKRGGYDKCFTKQY